MEAWPIRTFLLWDVMEKSGIPLIRQFASSLDAAVTPSWDPMIPPSLQQYDDGKENGVSDLYQIGKIHATAVRFEVGESKGFRYYTIEDYRVAYESGAISPVDVVRAFLDAVAESQSQSNFSLRIFIRFSLIFLLRSNNASSSSILSLPHSFSFK